MASTFLAFSAHFWLLEKLENGLYNSTKLFTFYDILFLHHFQEDATFNQKSLMDSTDSFKSWIKSSFKLTNLVH